MEAIEERVRADVPEGEALLERIRSTWLCAPEAFRYLKKLIAEIGALGSDAAPETVEPILQCENTYPDFDANREHFQGLLADLRAWREGEREALPVLRSPSPVKRWLVHLLWHKLIFQARYEENFARFMNQRPHGKSGSRKPHD